jgi:hypothetical protein
VGDEKVNPVEIEEAVSALAERPFDPAEFPYAFLEAFGNKETTIKRLRKGESNKSDLGGVLQTSNIHIAAAAPGEVNAMLAALRASPATAKAKAKFILATDGEIFEAEDRNSGETIACAFCDFPNKFGFFLPLAGITTSRQIAENAFDIRATGRLNRLYVELLKENPDWASAARRHDMNHFMARLIFCFFAEKTAIFPGADLFTAKVNQMGARDSSDTHQVISEIFRAMNTAPKVRATANLRPWADAFPYVNGGLFSGSTDVPLFSKIARSYLLHIGSLDWTKINPDIFGSMIQAVAEDEERSALGMHYTSVPNILKVLNPLFLDDLRAKLDEAGDNPRMLLNLRKRMEKIRVFDPACGSGNFLVIAYKEMRAIEAVINQRRGEADRRSEIPPTNFRGIELRDFPAEIARLALIIAEYQCDVLYRGQQEALQDFLPLDSQNWITCGNALRLDWLSICPPTGTGVKHHADDLFSAPLDQAQIDFENVGGETYICGNPPYQGSVKQDSAQKDDKDRVLGPHIKSYKDLDYVACWFIKAAEYIRHVKCVASFVSTNSICQGEQVQMLWPAIFRLGGKVSFAHTNFKWANNASRNAGVTCVIVGLADHVKGLLYDDESVRQVAGISPYLVAGDGTIVDKSSKPLNELPAMTTGNLPSDGGHLILTPSERRIFKEQYPEADKKFIRRFVGADELIKGNLRYCIWVTSSASEEAGKIRELSRRFAAVEVNRAASSGSQARSGIDTPYRFVFRPHKNGISIASPKVSSERREYLTSSIFNGETILSDLVRVIYDAPLWALAVLVSKLHIVWAKTVCGQLETRLRYSHTLAWNTFPIPRLTEKNKADLTRCAEDILLAREVHFPATIADLYDSDAMPTNLRVAHERNDEVLERIYIGRRFKNDTERLEKLFALYTEMTAKPSKAGKAKAVAR